MSFIHVGSLIVSMVLAVVIGFVWFGPLFGKAWMRYCGIPMPENKPGFGMMIKPILLSLLGAFFMNFVLASSIAFHNAYYSTHGATTALSYAFMLWLGFIVPIHFSSVGWEQKPWNLFWINTGYWLVYLLVAAAIVG